MKMQTVVIVGFGKMGMSHLLSFLNVKNCRLFIYDINFNSYDKIKKSINIKLLKFPPKNYKIDLLIVSTGSKERFNISKKIIFNNKIKYIFFEKFLFNKIHQLEEMSQILYKKKIKSYVNCWGKFLTHKMNKRILLKGEIIRIIVNEKSYLTNLIHFTDFFCNLIKSKNIIINSDDVTFFKKNGYSEAHGKFILEHKAKKIKCEIVSKKINCDFQISMNLNKISIKLKNFKLFFKNRNILKKIPFPLASKISSKYYYDILNNKKPLSTYGFIKELSIKIIKGTTKNLIIR